MTTTLTPNLLRHAAHRLDREQYMCCALSTEIESIEGRPPVGEILLRRMRHPVRLEFQSILEEHNIPTMGSMAHPHFPEECLPTRDERMQPLRFDFMHLLACAMESE